MLTPLYLSDRLSVASAMPTSASPCPPSHFQSTLLSEKPLLASTAELQVQCPLRPWLLLVTPTVAGEALRQMLLAVHLGHLASVPLQGLLAVHKCPLAWAAISQRTLLAVHRTRAAGEIPQQVLLAAHQIRMVAAASPQRRQRVTHPGSAAAAVVPLRLPPHQT